MKKLAPILVLVAVAVAAWFYVRAKAAERDANRQAVNDHCLETCGEWEECLDRISVRFDECFALAYDQVPRPGGDTLVAQRFTDCMNTGDFLERRVFRILPGEVPFSAR